MSGQAQPRVKRKRKNWSKGENFVILQKAITYYRLREDEIGESLHLMTEAAETYHVPISVLRRRIEDELVTDEGRGVGTALSKESEENLVKRLPKKKARGSRREKKESKTCLENKDVGITDVLIAEQITKPGKVASVPQVRKFLIKKRN